VTRIRRRRHCSTRPGRAADGDQASACHAQDV